METGWGHRNHTLRRRVRFGILLCLLGVCSTACSDDSDGWPSSSCSPPDYSGYEDCSVCSRPECCVDGFVNPACNYPDNLPDNTDQGAVAIGGSVVMGCCCFAWGTASSPFRCGFIPCLEELTGRQIANFGKQGQTIASEVNGLKKFVHVDTSIAVNPNATRVYILMGANDVILNLLRNAPDFPRPGNCCRLSDELIEPLRNTVSGMQRIVERYRVHHGVPQVVVASQPPVEEGSDAPKSCKTWTSEFCSDCYLCINEVLEVWSLMLADMVHALDGPENGIFFADLYRAFPQDPTECSLYCDCVHPNCIGMERIAEALHEAVP